MITILEGKESYQLNAKKKRLIQDSHAEQENIIVVDGSSRTSFSLESVLNLCSTISLFGDRRVVLVSSPYFLKSASGSSGKKSSKSKAGSPAELLDAYCKSPNPDTDLIFLCDGFLCDKRTKEYKTLASYTGTTVSIITYSNPSPWELEKLIDKELQTRGYKLSRDALNELKQRIGDSATEFYRTLEKMELYGGKTFDRKAIAGLVSFNPEVNVWNLSDAFVKGKRRSTMEAFYELREHAAMDVYAILPTLTYRLKRLFCVTRCDEAGLSMAEIRTRTGSGYPDRDLENCGNHSSAWFLKRLGELADLDQGMKNGMIDGMNGLELFLLRNLPHE
ncbi:MAG: DNA polymerase III subunit delta [Solobacterium sp.]|nr:DNA polymerase III subunit delta [Solobacterium sp.]